MIISRAPLRISLGGGGTDLPFYANKYGGSLITASINRHIYIMMGPRKVERNIKLNYSQTELVDNVDNIKHPLIREAMKLTGVTHGVEIHSMSDLTAGSGLGSSSAFLVALLNGLHYYKGETVSRYKLAEDASDITMGTLKEPIGKQDQYASAFGNLVHLKIAPNGKVTVTPINITHENIRILEKNLMMFYTGYTRSASDVLEDQKKRSEDKATEEDMYKYYHEIKKIGEQSKKCLEKGNLTRFGEWMNIHWELKKNLSNKMSNTKIDEWYKLAMDNGALGGKIIGAGGGGFLLFYVDKNHDKIQTLMEKEGLVYTPFKFDFEGARIIYNE